MREEEAEAAAEAADNERKATERNMMSEVSFSLGMLSEADNSAPPTFKHVTLFEVSLKDLVKDQTSTAEAISAAAEKTTPDYPFLHCLQKPVWDPVRGMVLNELSARMSAKGYLAQAIGVETRKKTFWFGLTNERDAAKKGEATQKLRVVVASDAMLRQIHSMSHGASLHREPRFENRIFRKRWATLVNMAELLHDKKRWENKPLRDIELCLPSEGGFDPTSSNPERELRNERTSSEQFPGGLLLR